METSTYQLAFLLLALVNNHISYFWSSTKIAPEKKTDCIDYRHNQVWGKLFHFNKKQNLAAVNGLIIFNVNFESKWLKQNAKNQHESIRISISLTQELLNFQMIKVLAEKKAGTDKTTEIEGF